MTAHRSVHVRLHKVLAERGVCARRKAERLIVAGRVHVNGVPVTELGAQVDPEADRIEVDGVAVPARSDCVYIVLHKPRGVVTACEDEHGASTVIDLVDVPSRVFPVGRLDKESTGVLLLTNDGELTLRLTHPRYGHEKEYLVGTREPLDDQHMTQLRAGVALDDGLTQPATVARAGARRMRIVLREGRKRQIRRMCSAVGLSVASLQRVRIENIELGALAPGAWRHLAANELDELRRRVDTAPAHAPTNATKEHP